MNTNLKTYSELSRLSTFNERFVYLKLHGQVGEDTFGLDRYINQRFYRSAEWKHVRDQVIVRDNGCDLGIADLPITGKVIIHHMNPITVNDFLKDDPNYLMNPEYLICVSHATHNAIHYGDDRRLIQDYIPRRPNDTSPWQKAHLYIVCGLIGSGKTTYASKLCQNVVDYDYIGSKIQQVNLALSLLKQGESVAYVTCLPTKYETTHLLSSVDASCTTFIWMNTSEEDCQQNILNRGRERDLNNLNKVFAANRALIERKDTLGITWRYSSKY